MRTVNNTCSITFSNFKNRDINSGHLKAETAKLIGKKYKLEYTERAHDNFDIRISVEPQKAYLSVKVYEQSLFRRDYRKDSQKGALRPSIAGAMVFECLSGLQSAKVVDNFCGSGTILCEALICGHKIFGGDISRDSVQIAKNNIAAIDNDGVDKCVSNIKVLDATNTLWPDNTFDAAISNLPWDKQVEVDFVTKLYADTIKEYRRILKMDGVLCLIGTRPEIAIKYLRLHFGKRDTSVYKLGYLGQTPSIVLSRPVGRSHFSIGCIE